MTFEMKTYYAEVEFEFCSSRPESKELAGGCTFVFVQAYDARIALDEIARTVSQADLKLLCVEFVSIYEGTEWADEESQARYDRLATLAETNGTAVMDELWGYGLP